MKTNEKKKVEDQEETKKNKKPNAEAPKKRILPPQKASTAVKAEDSIKENQDQDCKGPPKKIRPVKTGSLVKSSHMSLTAHTTPQSNQQLDKEPRTLRR
ncbi:hypothetical protein Pst134EA_003113 [Puccinia striiformis f. sp. tritici]|nr:hypothetical protein Pst134EA_003113 [Puccinia striiformis f. sp. tritici]KAH9472504.1 hypothetical protein Pst134EA_003113 [Puccinia striiformis f. sp. tritici]